MFLFLAVPSWSQTTVNGRVETGLNTTKPAACASGDQWNSIDSFAIYLCGPPNTWSIQAGTGASLNGLNTWIQSQIFRGPSPWVDITAYNVRAIDTSQSYSTIGTMVSGQNILTIAGQPVSGLNNLDGITIFGAGTTNAMSTPSAPTVTPSVAAFNTGSGITVAAPAGGNSFAYEIIAMKSDGAYTAASALGSTAIGGTLGPANVAITSLSRSGITVTVVTAAPHTMSIGTMVHISRTSDPTFVGWFRVSGTADNTHFTFTSGLSTNGDNAPASATGGTAAWFNCNHLTWSSVAGAWIYGIFGRTGGVFNLIGWSRPVGTTVSELYWDDFGSPMMDSPWSPAWVPTVAPSIATNGALTTTIVSGGGTTTLTLAAAAANSVTGEYTVFDDWPNILTAMTAANSAGVQTYFPPSGSLSFVISSFASIPATTTIRQAGKLLILDTVQVASHSVRWLGFLDSAGVNHQSGSAALGASISFSALPAIYMNSGGNIIQGLQLAYTGTNNALGMLIDGNSNNSYRDLAIATGGTNTDLMGMSVAFRSNGLDTKFKNLNMVGGPDNNTFDSTTTPQFLAVAPTGADGAGNFEVQDGSVYVRGFAWAQTGVATAVNLKTIHAQGVIMPFFTTTSTFGASYFERITIDSTPEPVFASFGNATSYVGTIIINNSYTGGTDAGSIKFPSTVSGIAISNLQVYSIPFVTPIGQNFNEYDCGAQNADIPIYGSPFAGSACEFRVPVHFPSQHTIYWDLGAPTGTGTVISAGGAVPIGTHQYQVMAQGPDGGYSPLSILTPAVVTGGNQTVTFSWAAKQGGTCYDVLRDGALANSAHCLTTLNYVDTFSFTTGGVVAPTIAGTGLTGCGPTGCYGPEFDLVGLLSGNISFKGRFTQPALTANRNWAQPDATGTLSLATIEDCGATTGATQACAKTVKLNPIAIFGDVTLNTATTQSITTLPFTSAASYSCTGSDLTTATGIVSFNTYAAASVTIQESGGINTDHLRWMCIGF